MIWLFGVAVMAFTLAVFHVAVRRDLRIISILRPWGAPNGAYGSERDHVTMSVPFDQRDTRPCPLVRSGVVSSIEYGPVGARSPESRINVHVRLQS